MSLEELKTTIKNLPIDVQNKILSSFNEIPRETPLRIEKYMKYVPGSEKITWEIPAMELIDPEKNKKLSEPDND